MATPNISFKPKAVVKKLLSSLPDRAREVLIFRYGLGKETKRLTLDAIGKKYGITRERVRQIENYGIDNVRKSDEYKAENVFWVPPAARWAYLQSSAKQPHHRQDRGRRHGRHRA